jgi:hypothetical protein
VLDAMKAAPLFIPIWSTSALGDLPNAQPAQNRRPAHLQPAAGRTGLSG